MQTQTHSNREYAHTFTSTLVLGVSPVSTILFVNSRMDFFFSQIQNVHLHLGEMTRYLSAKEKEYFVDLPDP